VTEGARQRILAAAVERIAAEGIDEMRIARVAMDAGVSTSLVHYHFETREALLAEALEYSYELAGDVRIGEDDDEDGLAHMIHQLLPYPGLLERDWILWVELWLRAIRHPDLRPTAKRLYDRMREWLVEGIDADEPERVADRLLALADGYGVRVLIGAMDIEEARREIWAALTEAQPLVRLNRRSGNRSDGRSARAPARRPFSTTSKPRPSC
jgi:AcrR family transcriptional regulator